MSEGFERLTQEFFNEEERWGYHISAKMKKIWALELDLLSKLQTVANELQITFFLDSGSLLGAVRDRHFIPWDDDIDVVMLRDDYDILLNNSQLFSSPYFLQSYKTEKEYNRPHAQLRNSNTTAILPCEGHRVKINQGIFIDIFALDGLIEDELLLNSQINEINRYKSILKKIYGPFSDNAVKKLLQRMRGILYNIFYPSYKELYERMDNEMKKYNNAKYVDKVGLRNDINSVHYLERIWFNEIAYIEFEGMKVPIPKEYDKILKEYYGEDYMEPSKAPSLHGEVIFDPDISYKEYLAIHHKG